MNFARLAHAVALVRQTIPPQFDLGSNHASVKNHTDHNIMFRLSVVSLPRDLRRFALGKNHLR